MGRKKALELFSFRLREKTILLSVIHKEVYDKSENGLILTDSIYVF